MNSIQYVMIGWCAITFHSHIYPQLFWLDNFSDSLFEGWMSDIYIGT